jgi:uncharacterized repeat protein (TIGR01451 family)
MKIKQLFTLALAAGISATSVAETVYNLDIDNTATLNYLVSGNAQTAVTADNTFKVDRKVVFVLTAPTSVESGVIDTQQGTAYTLVNNSNAPIQFKLSAVNVGDTTVVSIGGSNVTDTTDFDPAYTYYKETGANSTFAAGTNTQLAGGVIDLTAGDFATDGTDEATIYVVATPTVGVNADIYAHNLTVIATESAASAATLNTTNGGSLSVGDAITADTGVWVSTQIQTVFSSEGVDREGAGALQISSANVTMLKSVVILSDPYGSSEPKAIPGAVVQYTLTVTNSGSLDATNVSISDNVPTTGFDLTDSYVELFTVTDNAGTTTNPTSGSGVTVAAATSTFTLVTFDPVTVPANDGTDDGEVIVTLTVTLK